MTPLFTRTFAIIAGLLSVPVFGIGIIGTSYNSPFLTHLADIVHGTQTTTIVATNAPNWSLGLPMQTPIISSISTSSNPTAASGLASSTPYVFEVAALDNTGTTTLMLPATITTDASTTQPKPEDINIKWPSVNGATGYAIYFGTSTVVATAGLSQYFFATTSGQYTFSTSTGSLSGSYTKADTTAFSEILNPNGTDIFNDNLPNATSSITASTTGVQVNGTMVATAPATTTACESDTAGSVFFNSSNKHEWGCDGTNWNKIF